MRRIVFALAAAAGFAGAQDVSVAQRPEFDVATIKPSEANDGRTFVQLLPGGGLRASGGNVRGLVSLAFDLPSFEITGGPGWIDSDRFDVVAKADPSADSVNISGDPLKPTETQYQTMRELMRPKLQALLADRFQLKVHRETREGPVYTLVVGKNGVKLRPSNEFRGLHVARGQLTGNGATLEMLVTFLAGQLRRPVLDRTALKGAFEFTLEWTIDGPQRGMDPPLPADPGGPSIFTALQEQLGLKLESAKGPVEVLVIDRVERPSEN